MKKNIIITAVLFLVAVGTLTIWALKDNEPTNGHSNTVALHVDHPTYTSLRELEEDTEYIFIGTVRGEGKYRPENTQPGVKIDNPIPYTDYKVDVEEVIKGKIKEISITFSQLGGIWNDTLYTVEALPELTAGNSYVFFALEGDGKYGGMSGGYAVSPIVDGKFTLKEQTGIRPIEIIDITSLRKN